MRLKQQEIFAITSLAKKNFCPDVEVFLFVSRVNDELKGGDIDLMLKAKDESVLGLHQKLMFLVELKRTIGNRKIDVVLDNVATRSKQLFYQSITRTMVRIC